MFFNQCVNCGREITLLDDGEGDFWCHEHLLLIDDMDPQGCQRFKGDTANADSEKPLRPRQGE